ncbi:DUF4105 domain-containing protein [Flavobacterium sp.]|uniref:lipoprotein N-acyltransferase Lnb domain-containing protein n=1 Tax=Flavobacterium sp. TaxID=239 RepID=UPI0025F225E5|nr:DUF4105 domain-containing protein [Flavobacterium sp.]
MLKKTLFFSSLLFSLIGFSQIPKLSQNTKISVFTCDRGEELYSTFGHTALRIKDSANALDVVYNYGYFDFRVKNFYFKFVKGDLQYYMNVTSYEDFIHEYQADKRKVVEQTLNLPLIKKQQLFDALNSSLLSNEKFYTYKFIDRNCTSMIVDKINGLFSLHKIEKVDYKSTSYRTVLYPYFEDFFWFKLGINIIFGAKTDADAQKLFLPVELENSLDKATFNGKALVSKKEILIYGDKIQPNFSFLNSIYFIWALMLLLLVINKRFLFITYLFIAGILGIFLGLVGFYSEHQELLYNYNALLFNPFFVLIPFVKNNFLKKLNITLFLMLVIYLIIMITKPHFIIMLPFIITNFFIMFKINGNNPDKLLTSIK